MTCLNKDQSTSFIFAFSNVCCLGSQTNTKASLLLIAAQVFIQSMEGMALVHQEHLCVFKMGISLHTNIHRYFLQLLCFELYHRRSRREEKR